MGTSIGSVKPVETVYRTFAKDQLKSSCWTNLHKGEEALERVQHRLFTAEKRLIEAGAMEYWKGKNKMKIVRLTWLVSVIFKFISLIFSTVPEEKKLTNSGSERKVGSQRRRGQNIPVGLFTEEKKTLCLGFIAFYLFCSIRTRLQFTSEIYPHFIIEMKCVDTVQCLFRFSTN